METNYANDHPRKVAIVKDYKGVYANDHPYKVAVVEGGGGGEARVVDTLPDEGEAGYIYLVLKETTSEGDIYDEWIWALQTDGTTYDWEHLGATNEVTIKLYDEEGDNTDGAATQRLVTSLKGQARILTTADYNYPANNPTQVSLYRLEPGLYTWAGGVNVKPGDSGYPMPYRFAIVPEKHSPSYPYSYIYCAGEGSNYTQVYQQNSFACYRVESSGVASIVWSAASNQSVNSIRNYLRLESGAPTTSTSGYKGTLWVDSVGGKLYQCVDVNTSTSPATYTWEEVGGGGGGSIVKELTSADYNWPTTGTPTGVALWLLDPGMYNWASGVAVYGHTGSLTYNYGGAIVIKSAIANGLATIIMQGMYGSRNIYVVAESNGVSQDGIGGLYDIIRADNVYVMNGSTITGVRMGNTNTVGSGAISIGTEGIVSSAVYGIAIGRNAVNQASNGIAIGSSTNVYNTLSYGSIAIGQGATVGQNASSILTDAIALGRGARATRQGEINVEDTVYPTTGFNNTQYRLLSGLYDPQDAHDAATKGYVDTISKYNVDDEITIDYCTLNGSTLGDNSSAKWFIPLSKPVASDVAQARIYLGDDQNAYYALFNDVSNKEFARPTAEAYYYGDIVENGIVFTTPLIDISGTTNYGPGIGTFSNVTIKFLDTPQP